MSHATSKLMRSTVILGLVTSVVALLLVSRLVSSTPQVLGLEIGLYVVIALAWWRLGGLLILIVVQLYLFLSERTGSPFQWSWNEVMTAGMVLALVALVERSRAMRRSAPKLRWRDWSLGLSLAFGSQKKADLDVGQQSSVIIELGRAMQLLAGALCIVIVSQLILWNVPYDLDAPKKVRLRPTELRGVELATLLTVAYVMISWLVNEIIWRKLTPSQARAFLRGCLANWSENEWRAVVRQRRRNRTTEVPTNPAISIAPSLSQASRKPGETDR